MMMLPVVLGSALLALALPLSAKAGVVEFDISGTGSGTLNNVPFTDDAFDIRLIGNNSTVQTTAGPGFETSELDPLYNASVKLEGLGTSVLTEPTRFGAALTYPPGTATMFFARAGGQQSDLFDFNVPFNAAAAFQFQPGYGPIMATGVFALDQFSMETSNGLLTFAAASDVLFSSAPIPGTLPLMFSGLAAVLTLAWRRSRQSPTERLLFS
jgi:hypothetical protein